jgi:hypothetical protein
MYDPWSGYKTQDESRIANEKDLKQYIFLLKRIDLNYLWQIFGLCIALFLIGMLFS